MNLWQRKLEARTHGRKRMANIRLLELETAKQILEEVFHARPSDVEDMIQMRLDEKNWSKENWQEDEKMWPREFCLDELPWVEVSRALGWEPRRSRPGG